MNPRWRSPSVLIVEDNPTVRSGLRTLLELTFGLSNINEAGNQEEALQKIQQCNPELVLLDLHLDQKNMERLQGLDVLRQIKTASWTTRVFILTVDASETSRQESLAAGAEKFFMKGGDPEELLNAIRMLKR